MELKNLLNQKQSAKKKTSIDIDQDLLESAEAVCKAFNISFRVFFQAALKDAVKQANETLKERQVLK